LSARAWSAGQARQAGARVLTGGAARELARLLPEFGEPAASAAATAYRLRMFG
jgi:hypothetical protein